MVQNHWFKNCLKAKATTKTTDANVVKNSGFTTFIKIMLLEPLVLQHFQKTVVKTIRFTIIPKNRVAKDIGFTTCSKTKKLLEEVTVDIFRKYCC